MAAAAAAVAARWASVYEVYPDGNVYERVPSHAPACKPRTWRGLRRVRVAASPLETLVRALGEALARPRPARPIVSLLSGGEQDDDSAADAVILTVACDADPAGDYAGDEALALALVRTPGVRTALVFRPRARTRGPVAGRVHVGASGHARVHAKDVPRALLCGARGAFVGTLDDVRRAHRDAHAPTLSELGIALDDSVRIAVPPTTMDVLRTLPEREPERMWSVTFDDDADEKAPRPPPGSTYHVEEIDTRPAAHAVNYKSRTPLVYAGGWRSKKPRHEAAAVASERSAPLPPTHADILSRGADHYVSVLGHAVVVCDDDDDDAGVHVSLAAAWASLDEIHIRCLQHALRANGVRALPAFLLCGGLLHPRVAMHWYLDTADGALDAPGTGDATDPARVDRLQRAMEANEARSPSRFQRGDGSRVAAHVDTIVRPEILYPLAHMAYAFATQCRDAYGNDDERCHPTLTIHLPATRLQLRGASSASHTATSVTKAYIGEVHRAAAAVQSSPSPAWVWTYVKFSTERAPTQE